MKSRQIRRDRPTLKTAHKFFEEGSFSIDPDKHYTSRAERKAEIEAISNDLEVVSKKFPRTQNIEYALLKGHLIIEHALMQYIRGHATTFVTPKEIKFGFAQKLEVAYLLGFGANDPIVLPTVQGLNRIRNQIAHAFEFDRNALDEIFRINSEDYDEFSVTKDIERIRYLRWICRSICARVAGELWAAYTIEAHHDDPA